MNLSDQLSNSESSSSQPWGHAILNSCLPIVEAMAFPDVMVSIAFPERGNSAPSWAFIQLANSLKCS